MTNGLQERWGRETRLLVLIVVVSLAVLLLLARFRFPAARLDVAAPPAPGPLSNLVNRVAFADLAEAMATTAARVAPRVAVVRMTPSKPAPGRAGRGAASAPAAPPRFGLGLRVRPNLVLVRVPSGMTAAGLADGALTAEPVNADAERQLALFRVASSADSALDPVVQGFAGFAYVGEATATVDGPTLQPRFIGRVGSRSHDGWPGALVGLDTSDVQDGALLFTTEGRFVGLVVKDGSGAYVVPSAVIEAVVGELLATAGSAS